MGGTKVRPGGRRVQAPSSTQAEPGTEKSLPEQVAQAGTHRRPRCPEQREPSALPLSARPSTALPRGPGAHRGSEAPRGGRGRQEPFCPSPAELRVGPPWL